MNEKKIKRCYLNMVAEIDEHGDFSGLDKKYVIVKDDDLTALEFELLAKKEACRLAGLQQEKMQSHLSRLQEENQRLKDINQGYEIINTKWYKKIEALREESDKLKNVFNIPFEELDELGIKTPENENINLNDFINLLSSIKCKNNKYTPSDPPCQTC